MRLKGLVAVAIAVLLAVHLAGSVTRAITDAQDNREALIRNSNGKYWPAEGQYIQAAIDDLSPIIASHGGYGGTFATVWLPANTTLTVPSTVLIKGHVTLEMSGSKIVPSGDFDVVELMKSAEIRDGTIDVSSVSNFDHAAVTFNTSECCSIKARIPKVENMALVSEGLRGKGLHLHTEGTASQAVIVMFRNIKITKFEYGILLNQTNANGFINANIFSNIDGYGNKYFIKIFENQNEAAGNYFQNVRCYCSADTEYIIWNNGEGNVFDNIIAYDWDNNGGTRKSYDFSADGTGGGNRGSDGCFLSYRGGGADLAIGPWHRFQNTYTLLDLEKSNLTLWKVTPGA